MKPHELVGFILGALCGAAAIGFLIGYIIHLVSMTRRSRETRRRLDIEKLRSIALTELCEVNQKIRNGTATIEDVERSFFLDGVIVHPERYVIENGVFKRNLVARE